MADLMEIRVTADRLARESRRPKRGEVELRTVSARAAVSDGVDNELNGMASVFDEVYPVWDFDEVFRAGAFSKTLKEMKKIFMYYGHDSNRVLASRSNGSLELTETANGLKVRAALPDTTDGRDTITLVRGGYVEEMSIGFSAIKEEWTWGKRGERDLREILEAKLYEVSVVALGANGATYIRACDAPTDADAYRALKDFERWLEVAESVPL